MASERKGKVYESLIYCVLTQLIEEGMLKGKLFWNETPAEMSFEPDFTIGQTSHSPRYGLLVTHCGSPRNSDMKGWRNLGELADFKTALARIPSVSAITFGRIKEDIAPLQHTAFDSFRWVTDRPLDKYPAPQPWLVLEPWARWLDEYVGQLEPELPEKASRKEWICGVVSLLGTKGRKDVGYEQLKVLLRQMLAETNRHMPSVWQRHRARTIPASPSARPTSVRTGLSKILLFPDPLGASVCARRGSPLPPSNNSPLLFQNNLVRSISHGKASVATICDRDIIGLSQLLPEDNLKHLIDTYHVQGDRWFRQIATTPLLPRMLAVLRDNWTALSDAVNVFGMMRAAHHGICNGINVGYTWPYYRLTDCIKLNSGFVQGYGLAKMLADIDRMRGNAKHCLSIAKIAAIPERQVKLRAVRSIERLISVQLGDWRSPWSSELFSRYPCDMAEVAMAMAGRLRGTSRGVLDDTDAFSRAIFQSNITNGFAVWRLFEPLSELVSLAISGATPTRIRTCYAEGSGADVRDDAGEMHVLQVGHTVINVQSWSDHKAKELCGRAIGLRYTWDGHRFVPRSSIHRMLLVLDGEWPQKELDVLLRSGWDGIFYPDEMDRLKKEIV